MVVSLSVDNLLKLHSDQYMLFDVRSPSEYMNGHMPEAVSLPLFSDEERAEVGTAYKQESPEKAMQLGLAIAGPKMSGIVQQVVAESAGRRIVLHCWRGGKRSGSVGWLLDFAGLPVSVLSGGYKSYRTFQRHWLESTPLQLVILGGKTGSGKTELLQELRRRGEQVLDLENLANHKGSAFGWIGEEEQPSTEQFENNIFEVLRWLDPSRRIWVENESKAIGRVVIPEALWVKMKAAPLVHLEVPLSVRVQKLVDIYAAGDVTESLATSFQKISRRLGGQHVKAALEALHNRNFHSAAEIALTYYDKTYYYGLENSLAPVIEKVLVNAWDVDEIIKSLLQIVKKMEMAEVSPDNGI